MHTPLSTALDASHSTHAPHILFNIRISTLRLPTTQRQALPGSGRKSLYCVSALLTYTMTKCHACHLTNFYLTCVTIYLPRKTCFKTATSILYTNWPPFTLPTFHPKVHPPHSPLSQLHAIHTSHSTLCPPACYTRNFTSHTPHVYLVLLCDMHLGFVASTKFSNNSTFLCLAAGKEHELGWLVAPLDAWTSLTDVCARRREKQNQSVRCCAQSSGLLFEHVKTYHEEWGTDEHLFDQ